MGTSISDIRRWLEEAKKAGATHVIVVCDTYDWEDYPVNVMPGQDVRKVAAGYTGKNMQKVMEVYSLTEKHDINAQLKKGRSFNYD